MLREDTEKLMETPTTEEMLKNAPNRFEEYYVAPSASKSSAE